MTETVVPRRGRSLAIGAGGLAVLLGALDTYVVIGLFRQIMEDLQIPVNRLERLTPIVTGYLLGYIAAMPLLGQASDRFGRKRLLQVCLGMFVVGSVLTATAPDLPLIVTGRVVLGVAGGALLPVTMALAADLWSHQRRATVLGAVGAAQELGSVLGPVYGITLAAATGWRGVFWINVPLALLAMVAVHFSVPSEQTRRTASVDVVGGGLLAVTLGLLVIGLYNPEPGEQVLPDWGVPVLAAAAVIFIAFVLHQVKATHRLIDPTRVRMKPFLAALGVSLAAGAALMVTLVDVDLFAQTLLGLDDEGGVLLLLRFLVALPVGALIGGVLTSRFGERWLAVASMVLAAVGFWLMSAWTVDVQADPHVLGPFMLPRLDTDLVVVGLGLGLVIAPLSSAVLRVTSAEQHGVASAGVVVARMTGMLVGIAALSAWGLHRFHSMTASLDVPLPMLYPSDEAFQSAMDAYTAAVKEAMVTQYTEIFAITGVVCIAGALCATLITARSSR
ncbi:MFS transporter [Saccharomonospora viridis]|uniref:Arabinose efflux permease family protein n=1 Tax=Saccharomonospora viridis (strain ATCC 15386 / DSM 43017 / JCM 3036 / CCUG 5913 / NBRC 12207 / NCIMB 9602 / P101) TaxID=471857 RepID=C7MUR7_SACVD|nr:MFS transporter [Saccharomonospora viridis]ACU95630.1 arabinose efflux permease family protein [Saccharomonospora viridis DSM 43017]